MMYQEQFKILDDILENTQINQIWSAYSLCNHNHQFEGLEKCKDILISFVKNLSMVDKSRRETIELVYLINGDISSDNITYRLISESELNISEEELDKYNIYGIIKRFKDNNLQEMSDSEKNYVNLKNNSQFKLECQDIYKNISSTNLLYNNLWFSRYSQISNFDSLLSRYNANNVNAESKTEPYPSNLNINISDSKVKNEFNNDENNTDPYPNKDILDNELNIKENNNNTNVDLMNETKSKQFKTNQIYETINLFEDNNYKEGIDDYCEDKELESVENINVKSNKRKKKKLDETNNSKMKDEKMLNDIKKKFNPLEVEPIIYNKVKKEKMYQDNETGYLVVEDEIDFVIEKEKKINIEKTSLKKSNKTKKDSNLDNKQQTLNSFFKITKKNDAN